MEIVYKNDNQIAIYRCFFVRLAAVDLFTILVYSKQMRQHELFFEETFEKTKDEFSPPPDLSGSSGDLFELSIDAYYSALYARMSELPIEKEISRFIEKVYKAAAHFAHNGSSAARSAASRLASDRGDPDVCAVLNAAFKVQYEIHRLTGLLRFSPNSEGMYIARCSPDHYILPGLADHFFLRFGETPWAIIDEKREVCLCREKGEPPKLIPLADFLSPGAAESSRNDSWEDLWRLYHRSVNNETRKNLRLQRQFMPLRYQKYLPEK